MRLAVSFSLMIRTINSRNFVLKRLFENIIYLILFHGASSRFLDVCIKKIKGSATRTETEL